MKFALFIPLILCGCFTSRTISVATPDGTATNYFTYVAAGGLIRPGTITVFMQTKGTNSSTVLQQASGPPIAPSITGAAGNVAAAATLSGLWPDQSDRISSTTVIQDDSPHTPNPPPIVIPSRPPFGPPPWHDQHGNRGR
jgi:hypothetical protein